MRRLTLAAAVPAAPVPVPVRVPIAARRLHALGEYRVQPRAHLAGLSQENMNRGAGWRFLDMGRRIERGINTCRFTRTLADGAAVSGDVPAGWAAVFWTPARHAHSPRPGG